MSGGEKESAPAGDSDAQKNSADHDPCKITGSIPGIGGLGDENCLLSFLRVGR